MFLYVQHEFSYSTSNYTGLNSFRSKRLGAVTNLGKEGGHEEHSPPQICFDNLLIFF